MRTFKRSAAIILFFSILFFPFDILSLKAADKNFFNTEIDEVSLIYDRLELDAHGLKYEVFFNAARGHAQLSSSSKTLNPGLISIVDLSQPSTNKRLYIIDLNKQELLFNTYVSHGKNTGDLFAEKFSNIPESLQSSLGFYVTGKTYQGKHGLSLQLHGMEPGINDKAFQRAIVIHGADYVSEKFIRQTGRLGRSFGCPAISNELTESIISTIKDGTGLFVYYPDKKYLEQSTLLKN